MLVDRYSGRKPHLYTPRASNFGASWVGTTLCGASASNWNTSPLWADGNDSGRNTHLGDLLLAQCGLILISVLYAALLRVIGIDRQFGAPKLYLVEPRLYTPRTKFYGAAWANGGVTVGNIAQNGFGKPTALDMYLAGRAVYTPCRAQLGGTHDHTERCSPSLWFSGNIIYLKFTYAGRSVYMHLGDVYLEHFMIVGG